MKLVLIGLTSVAYATTSSTGVTNVVSTCGGNEQVEIKFSYSSDQINDATVGEAKVGTCSGAQVTTSYDALTDLHTFSVADIYDCGLDDIRNPSDISTYGYELEIGFDAMKNSQGMMLAFETGSFFVSCDLQDTYTTSYAFHEGLEMTSENDGEVDDGLGQVGFETQSYSDGTVR